MGEDAIRVPDGTLDRARVAVAERQLAEAEAELARLRPLAKLGGFIEGRPHRIVAEVGEGERRPEPKPGHRLVVLAPLDVEWVVAETPDGTFGTALLEGRPARIVATVPPRFEPMDGGGRRAVFHTHFTEAAIVEHDWVVAVLEPERRVRSAEVEAALATSLTPEDLDWSHL